MTRDTKIGLLLGLVFIFIIAFLINGLPRLKGRSQNTPSTRTNNRTPIVSPGIAPRERFIATQMPGPAFPTPAGAAAGQPLQSGEIRSVTPLPMAGTQQPALVNPSSEPPATQVSNAGTPSGSPALVQGAANIGPGTSQSGAVMPVSRDATIPVRNLAGGPAPQPAAIVQSTGTPGALTPAESMLPSPVGAVSPAPNAMVNGSQLVPATVQQPTVRTTGEWPKTYKVVKGDSLEAIAKRMYGSSEGVKPASIKRIFEANKAILKSPQDLDVDQQLTIPAPAAGAVAVTPTSPAAVTPASKQTATQKPITTQKPTTVKSSDTQGQRLYTVKEGDTLWKIATSQLGKGTRYQEIVKLNASTLKNSEDNLEQGMKLHLPAK